MNRSRFLKTSAAAAAPFILNGFPITATAGVQRSFYDALAQVPNGCGNILVIIQQNGGNDGLNTVLPVDKYQHLSNARANILIPQNQLLSLSNNTTTALHPAMTELRNMYNDGKVCLVQGVSYPNPNFSHFRATDIWFSGSSSTQYLDSGWLGRSLDVNYDDYPVGYPNSTMQDPLAVQIGSTLPFSLQGPAVNMGYNVSNPASLLNVINATTDPSPDNDYGHELTFLRQMKDQSNAYTSRITAAYNAQSTQSSLYPASGNSLANQLKIVARLIGGGLKTPVYIVNHPGSHDSHENQLVTQANNLAIFSAAVSAFQNDLEMMHKEEIVTGMTFSEFGRRIISNAGGGTDHGTAAPVIFFGAALNAGMIGTSPDIPLNATVNNQIPMQHDFRQLYATVMKHWLCLTEAESVSVLGSSFTTLPIFQAPGIILPLEGVTLSGQYYDGQSRLTCKVLDNTKYQWYSLEFSADGTNYQEIRRKSNSNAANEEMYYFTHESTARVMYYRVAGPDLRGKMDYSNVVVLRGMPGRQLMQVYPNPVKNFEINVKLFESTSEMVDVCIYDLAGRKLYFNRFSGSAGAIRFRVPSMFSADSHYVLEVRYGSTVLTEQILFN